MSQDLKINEDWERESLKDLVYLHEESMLLEQQIQEEIHKKQPARIVVVDKDKILEKQHEFKDNPLPF